jgi:hypothetical protein
MCCKLLLLASFATHSLFFLSCHMHGYEQNDFFPGTYHKYHHTLDTFLSCDPFLLIVASFAVSAFSGLHWHLLFNPFPHYIHIATSWHTIPLFHLTSRCRSPRPMWGFVFQILCLAVISCCLLYCRCNDFWTEILDGWIQYLLVFLNIFS